MNPEELETAYRGLLRQLVFSVRNIDAFIEHMNAVEDIHPAKRGGIVNNARRSQVAYERALGKNRRGLKFFWETCDRAEIAEFEGWTAPDYTHGDQ